MPVEEFMGVVRQSRYPLDAFLFVQRGLDYTIRRIHGEPDEASAPLDAELAPDRHVDGQTLCFGLRDYAKQQYGLMARTVLSRWNIHRCEDFGRIIFTLVDAGLMQKTDDDSKADFEAVYDFHQVFEEDLALHDLSL